MNASGPPPLFGLMAEFSDVDVFLKAVKHVRNAGFAVEAYAPFSVEGLPEAVGFDTNRVPLATLIGGIIGGVGGYFLQWYSAVVDYPINIGGRPLHSWPSFIPITFETTILGAALAAVFGMLLMNGLPRLRHPVFNAPDFDLVTRDRFFLVLRANDPHFDRAQAGDLLQATHPVRVCEVPT